MIKHFCDVCGQQALESMPVTRCQFPNMTWTGPKPMVGIGRVDGTWTPSMSMRIIFELHDTKETASSVFPDLCLDCVLSLIIKMRGELAYNKERATPEQAREGFQKMSEAAK